MFSHFRKLVKVADFRLQYKNLTARDFAVYIHNDVKKLGEKRDWSLPIKKRYLLDLG